jgi:hypothetical protein
VRGMHTATPRTTVQCIPQFAREGVSGFFIA